MAEGRAKSKNSARKQNETELDNSVSDRDLDMSSDFPFSATRIVNVSNTSKRKSSKSSRASRASECLHDTSVDMENTENDGGTSRVTGSTHGDQIDPNIEISGRINSLLDTEKRTPSKTGHSSLKDKSRKENQRLAEESTLTDSTASRKSKKRKKKSSSEIDMQGEQTVDTTSTGHKTDGSESLFSETFAQGNGFDVGPDFINTTLPLVIGNSQDLSRSHTKKNRNVENGMSDLNLSSPDSVEKYGDSRKGTDKSKRKKAGVSESEKFTGLHYRSSRKELSFSDSPRKSPGKHKRNSPKKKSENDTHSGSPSRNVSRASSQKFSENSSMNDRFSEMDMFGSQMTLTVNPVSSPHRSKSPPAGRLSDKTKSQEAKVSPKKTKKTPKKRTFHDL